MEERGDGAEVVGEEEKVVLGGEVKKYCVEILHEILEKPQQFEWPNGEVSPGFRAVFKCSIFFGYFREYCKKYCKKYCEKHK